MRTVRVVQTLPKIEKSGPFGDARARKHCGRVLRDISSSDGGSIFKLAVGSSDVKSRTLSVSALAHLSNLVVILNVNIERGENRNDY